METQLEQIREQQRASWNKFSSGWKKWDDLTMKFLRPAGEAIINQIEWKDNFQVLDIASGTGEPGLTTAGIVKNGRVVATDLSEQMVEVAKENALLRGLKNFETAVCGVELLPFESNTFDVTLCRYGFMFFPDLASASAEMARVTKTGGKIVSAVWASPERNNWATTIMSVINKMVEMPVMTPDTPALFRCAKPGYVSAYLSGVGLKNMTEKEIQFELVTSSIDEYWNFITEVAAPVVMGLNKADESTREKIKNTVYENAGKMVKNGKVHFTAATTIITAEK